VRPFRATLWAVLSLGALLASSSTVAATQEPGGTLPVSLERIREDLEKPPPPRLKPAAPVHLPPTFKSRVDQRTWVPTLKEHLHKTFDLTPMQRQSADWAAKCCGLKLGQFLQIAEDAVRARKIRKTREQIARELAELEAATRTSPPK
jgi:hypothetical protein